MKAVYKSRNSLVHAGRFGKAHRDEQTSEYLNLRLLSGTILLRLAGLPSDLHQLMVD